jgi:hypothetical protein
MMWERHAHERADGGLVAGGARLGRTHREAKRGGAEP